MDLRILREYRRRRASILQNSAKCFGDHASAVQALNAARVKVAFDDAEYEGLVKLKTKSEIDVYDDSYVDTWDVPEKRKVAIKKEIAERIAREGVWILVGYYRLSEGDPWESTDSVGGFIGDDWKGSGYDTDVMASALKALAEAQLRDRAEHFEVHEPVAEGWA